MTLMRRAVPAAAVVVVLSAVAGGMFGSKVAARQDRANERYRVYLAALDAIENEYVEPIEETTLVYGSIDGLLRTLDPHSASSTRALFSRCASGRTGRYFGIGISILSIDGEITVTSLFEGSPAYKAGIRRNDVIARVGKEETKPWGRTRAGRPKKWSAASRDRRARPSTSRSAGRASIS